MSLNWREIALITSELPLKESLIQRVHQIGFHALVFELHHPQHRFWQLYVEVGTDAARIHRISSDDRSYRKQKTRKLQRFIQYIRAHVEGARIAEVRQVGGDRILLLTLTRGETLFYLILRFYSGPGANVIICDRHMVIRELLFRRPGRNEATTHVLELPPDREDDGHSFPVRAFSGTDSFNAFIEQTYAQKTGADPQKLIAQIEELRDSALHDLYNRLRQAEHLVKQSTSYASHRTSGDLLSANAHLIVPKERWVTVPDHTTPEAEATVTIELDPNLSAGENIEAYYRRYRKGKTAHQRAIESREALKRSIEETTAVYEGLLSRSEQTGLIDLAALQQHLTPQHRESRTAKADPYAQAPGLRFTSSIFTLLVGRNAKENEALLRRWAKGNDWWLHTRDVPGGYVIIKSIAGKTIPLETILDAGNLALLYSKAKDAGKADLYYTQVKYLKRPKKGKPGLVLPTQEKNITVELDDQRISRLFAHTESGAVDG